MSESLDLLHLKLIEIIVKAFQQAIECHFRSIRNKREHGILHFVPDSFQHGWHKQLAELLALTVYVHVTSAAEIDALKRTCRRPARRIYLLQPHASMLVQQDCLSGLQLTYALGRHIHRSLYDSPLRSEHHHFVIHIPERRPDAPRVPHSERFSASRKPAYDISAVPFCA